TAIGNSQERNLRREHVGFWPVSEVMVRLVEVREARHSGLDLLTWSSSHFDPHRTCRSEAGAPLRPNLGVRSNMWPSYDLGSGACQITRSSTHLRTSVHLF